MVWREARQNNDFKTFLPYQQEVLNLTQQIARAKGEALGLSPYDALLDSFDPGTRQTDIDPIFSRLSADLPGLIATVLDKQRSLPPAVPLQGPFAYRDRKHLAAS